MSKPILPPGSETCGCCEGVEASTPTVIDNRPGLSAIAYRIGTHAEFKESLTAGLSSASHAALARLLTRDSEDFTIGLLDAFSCAADVLTFYQERLANESYLRTATERVSLQELARLIGYRLRPGVAAETWLAFALETPRTPPPGSPPEPGSFVTGIPASLTLATGLKVQSVPGQDEKPQTFETVESIEARPEWNAIRPTMSEVRYPGRGATFTYLQGVGSGLKPGDALVFAGQEFLNAPATSNIWDFRLVDEVKTEPAADRTYVSWKRGLGSMTPRSDPPAVPRVFVLHKRAAIFGHNAPMWKSMNREFQGSYPDGGLSANDWPAFTPSPNGATDAGGYVDLDAVYGEVVNGSLVVLAKGEFNRPDAAFPAGTYVELYRVTSTTEVSRAQFALSGKVTRLGLAGQNLRREFYPSATLRGISVYLQSEEFHFAPYPIADEVGGDHLALAVAGDSLELERRLIISGARSGDGRAVVHQATVVSVAPRPNGIAVEITLPLPAALRRDSVVVYGNVALATHGETGSQILGAGDASRAFQRFELKRTPLTYRAAPSEIGAKSELNVRVGDVEWAERATMSGAAAEERAYTLRTDENEKTWVVFGDGQRGARLPSGVNNVQAKYRQGLGKAGNVAAEKLTQLLTRPPGLKSVSNPQAASGGTEAEPADQARRTMPLGTRTLGRAVSLLDYEDFALAFTGIAKAQARVLQLAAGPTIAITVAGQDGALLSPSNPVWSNLLLALKASGDPHVSVMLLSYQASTFRLGLKVKRDPAYDGKAVLVAVETELRVHYAFAARELGQPVLQSDVIATAHRVRGVVAVDLDFLYCGTVLEPQTVKSLQPRLLATRMHVDGGQPRPAELLTLDLGPLDRLEEMA